MEQKLCKNCENQLEYIGYDKLAGENSLGITPEFCCRLGAALGSVSSKVGIGCDESVAASAFKSAMSAGVGGVGAQVWDFGPIIESQMAFVTAFCRLDISAYISVGPKCTVRLIGGGGLPIARSTELEIERRMADSDFAAVPWNCYRPAADVSGLGMLYRQHIASLAPDGLVGMSARVRCPSRQSERLFEDTLRRLGCNTAEGMLMTLSHDGTALSITDNLRPTLSAERTFALCCLIELKTGHDLTVPADTPLGVDDMAAHYGRRVTRYARCPSDSPLVGSDLSQLFLRDGIMAAVYILSYLRRTGLTLDQLTQQLPEFSTAECTLSSAETCRACCNTDMGTVVNSERGRVLVSPLGGRRGVRLTAEAADAETAADICDEVAARLLANLDKRSN